MKTDSTNKWGPSPLGGPFVDGDGPHETVEFVTDGDRPTRRSPMPRSGGPSRDAQRVSTTVIGRDDSAIPTFPSASGVSST